MISQSVAAYESAARNKLRLGLTRLARAGNDPESLGFALVSLHGALEDHVRARIANNMVVPPSVRQDVLARIDSSWPRLVELLKTFESLEQSDAQLILHANNLRVQASHGNEFRGTVHHVRAYGSLVQRMILGTSARSSAAPMPTMPARSPTPEPPRPSPDAPAYRTFSVPGAPPDAPIETDQPRRAWLRPPRGRPAFCVVLVLAAILLAVYSHQRLYPMIVAGPGTPDPTGAAPASTPLPTGTFWVENYRLTEMWSGPAGDDGVVSFGTTSSQFCSFLVVRPQDNPRLYVLNPYSNNYLWIDAEAVGPVPPPEHGAEPPPADQNCTAAIVP